ncbi:G0/G1 switch protein 2 [Pristis pectinata]|uniref:G0/G1 switch protein 2 n=1 Tax=Pristis pectinata TaxID=685728 RepID=UPI00223E3CAA|nr:G0/G1 switch protein 2 [Pristis pectinata]
MEMMSELIPFAREMLNQRPNRKMLKIYAVGTVLAFLGVVVGLVETVCSPFTSSEGGEQLQEAPLPRAQHKEPHKQNEKEEPSPIRHRKHAS